MPMPAYDGERELTNGGRAQAHGPAAGRRACRRSAIRPGSTGSASAPTAAWTSASSFSTDADQIAVAPGTLRREWTQGGRRYFDYRAGDAHPAGDLVVLGPLPGRAPQQPRRRASRSITTAITRGTSRPCSTPARRRSTISAASSRPTRCPTSASPSSPAISDHAQAHAGTINYLGERRLHQRPQPLGAARLHHHPRTGPPVVGRHGLWRAHAGPADPQRGPGAVLDLHGVQAAAGPALGAPDPGQDQPASTWPPAAKRASASGR